MAAIRITATLYREILQPPLLIQLQHKFFNVRQSFGFSDRRGFGYSRIRCAASEHGDVSKRASARLSQVQQLLIEAEERAGAADSEPPPKITLEHVNVSFARSGGPGGQNVNKVNTKVDMRFNVRNATWLSERIREKIMLTEKNRINKDGEIVISSTKTRTQQGNIQDALDKLQAIIDAAAYVPPPPSEEQKKKIAKLPTAQQRMEGHFPSQPSTPRHNGLIGDDTMHDTQTDVSSA